MSDAGIAYLTPEAKARVEIDRMLVAAGWAVQDSSLVNLSASRGVAVREFVLKSPHGRVDYLLFVDGKAVGVLEAKKEGQPLTGVEWQSARYVDGLPDEMPRSREGTLPFAYESLGLGIGHGRVRLVLHFQDGKLTWFEPSFVRVPASKLDELAVRGAGEPSRVRVSPSEPEEPPGLRG